MPAYVAPFPVFRAFDALGNPLIGGKLYTYDAGTSNPKATWTDSTQTAANTNPVILDSRGEARVWLDGNYRLVLKDSQEVQQWDADDVQGVGSGSGTNGTTQASEWLVQTAVPTYVSATQFTVDGDATAILHVGRRTRCQVSAGAVYGTITESSFSTGITTVTQDNDSLALDAGLSAVSVGINSADNPSIHVSAVKDAASAAFSPGDIKMHASANVESGWVLCDGTVYDSILDNTYAPLYAAIGNLYGGTDGSDFQVPDLRGRGPIGFGQGDTAEGGGTGTARSLSDKVGAETHSLTGAENGPHTHTVNQAASSVGGAGGVAPDGVVGGNPVTTESSGSGTGHNNMGPSLVLSFLIKL